jgi:DNA-3-methyladenine glycosylase II
VPVSYSATPLGHFDLSTTRDYFGPWDSTEDGALLAAFPVEGWQGSAAVAVHQPAPQEVSGEVTARGEVAGEAWQQLLASLSLDVDGSGFRDVGKRDPVIKRLQDQYRLLRPVSFYSPYEAAVGLILGQRSSIAQQRRVRRAMSEQFGETFDVDGTRVSALPAPAALLEIASFKGVSAEKIARLHAAAEAALDGVLDRRHLRSIPYAQALDEVRAIRGVGEWTAQGIVLRGANLADEVSDDQVTKRAVHVAYGLETMPDHAGVLEIAENWRPYRMWASVLLHVWLRRERSDQIPRSR